MKLESKRTAQVFVRYVVKCPYCGKEYQDLLARSDWYQCWTPGCEGKTGFNLDWSNV